MFFVNARTARKALAIVCSLIFVISLSVTAFARWDNVSDIGTVLSFDGTTAVCTATIDGYSGTTKISAIYQLQRKSGTTYTTIKTWTSSGTREYLDWSDEYTVTRGYTYRLKVTATVTIDGVAETATGWVNGTLN
jgi:hypothetical protein